MRLIDADALKEAFYNRHRTPDDVKYLRVPAEVVYQFIDNAPTVDPGSINIHPIRDHVFVRRAARDMKEANNEDHD